MQINIMVEGYDDQELVAALLVKLGKVRQWDKSFQGFTAGGNQVAIYEMGGWTTLPTNKLLPRLQQSLEVDVLNLVIYDADTPAHASGGVAARRAELQQQARTLGLSFELFLLPTDAADGNLENLLESLIPAGHRQVLNCFTAYEACMSGCLTPTGTLYRLPADKSKFYAYVEAMPITDEERKAHKSRGATKYFANSVYWNLDANEVQPLCNFLSQYVQ
ncbi:MAG: DUF3226 domain-containing protein [Janthinobacterium lividum]